MSSERKMTIGSRKSVFDEPPDLSDDERHHDYPGEAEANDEHCEGRSLTRL